MLHWDVKVAPVLVVLVLVAAAVASLMGWMDAGSCGIYW